MPASISSVTLMGFGNGTFSGSVNLLPTLGYGIGVAAAPILSGGLVAAHHNRVLIAEHHTRVLIAGRNCC